MKREIAIWLVTFALGFSVRAAIPFWAQVNETPESAYEMVLRNAADAYRYRVEKWPAPETACPMFTAYTDYHIEAYDQVSCPKITLK